MEKQDQRRCYLGIGSKLKGESTAQQYPLTSTGCLGQHPNSPQDPVLVAALKVRTVMQRVVSPKTNWVW